MKSKKNIERFLDEMKLPDGTPIVSVDFLDWLISEGFFTAPASTKYHGNVEGGLFEHSIAVKDELVYMTNKLSRQNRRRTYGDLLCNIVIFGANAVK